MKKMQLLVVHLSIFCYCALFVSVRAQNKKPNVMIILADDVGQGDIPIYFNSSAVQMPNIERLASQGLLFHDMHSTPLCAPSRYMLLSGNYQHRGRNIKGTWSLTESRNQFKKNQKSLAHVFKDAGYKTGMFGKYHLGSKIPPGGVIDRDKLLSSEFHDWNQPLLEHDIGFDFTYVTMEGIQRPPYAFFRNGYLDIHGGSVKDWSVGEFTMEGGTSKIIVDGEGSASWDSTMFNQIVVNETEAFLDNHLKFNANDPFFSYVALGAIHLPHSPPTHFIDGSAVAGEYPVEQLDMLHEMDLTVGKIIDILESRGLAQDTIILFTSDNGGLRPPTGTDLSHEPNGNLRGRKGSLFEGGTRVPFILRHDGNVPAGESRGKLLSLSDVFATLCEIVGIDIPKKAAKDSVSFAKYLKSESNTAGLRNSYASWKIAGKKFHSAALRRDNYKLIQNHHDSTFEFYNLTNDLSEENNLSEDVTHAPLIFEMTSELTELGPCAENKVGDFEITLDGGETQTVNCTWFASQRKERCGIIKKSKTRKLCPRVCGRFRKFCDTLP